MTFLPFSRYSSNLKLGVLYRTKKYSRYFYRAFSSGFSSFDELVLIKVLQIGGSYQTRFTVITGLFNYVLHPALFKQRSTKSVHIHLKTQHIESITIQNAPQAELHKKLLKICDLVEIDTVVSIVQFFPQIVHFHTNEYVSLY